MRTFLWLLAAGLLFRAHHSARWSSTSSPDGYVQYACAGDNVTLTWDYALSSRETLGEIEWYVDNVSNSHELIAFLAHGFLVTIHHPANTLEQAASTQTGSSAGLTVRNVTVEDSGNYSVEVSVDEDSGIRSVLQSSVFLQISDGLATQDGQLHASKSGQPVLDSLTDQWALQLQCGPFTFTRQPHYQLEWVTPSGSVVNSTHYSSSGQFLLLLTSPIEGGNYTCRVPQQSVDAACVGGSDVSQREATVYVDATDARFTLLEKENRDLKRQLVLSQSALSQQCSDLGARVEKLENRTRQQVGFHGTGLEHTSPPHNTPLLLRHVHYNIGDGYNRTTGKFTAPYSGIYFFIATTGLQEPNHGEYHYLYVDGVVIDAAFSFSEPANRPDMSSSHAVVHMAKGAQAWIQSMGASYWSDVTSFSGALLSADF